MKHVKIDTRLKNQIFVGNGSLLVPNFFAKCSLGNLRDSPPSLTVKCRRTPLNQAFYGFFNELMQLYIITLLFCNWERKYNHMPEFSRILIEEYCMNHPKTKKSKFLWKMVQMSYDIECEAEEWEMLYLDQLISRENLPHPLSPYHLMI